MCVNLDVTTKSYMQTSYMHFILSQLFGMAWVTMTALKHGPHTEISIRFRRIKSSSQIRKSKHWSVSLVITTEIIAIIFMQISPHGMP